MGIVATKSGGLIPCEGGPYRTAGRDAVKALSWAQVENIAHRFKSLNPYDRRAVPGSILKIEDDNSDPTTSEQRQLYCFAISAKRYALFLQDQNAAPVLLRDGENNNQDRWSEHGLGHLLNPIDLHSDDRHWIAQAWLNMVRRSTGKKTKVLPSDVSPAVSRITISSPAVIRPLANLNHGKSYYDQIKPFNFLLTTLVKQFGHPVGTDPEHFHLITPYELNPSRWHKNGWIDQYSGNTYRILTTGDHGTRKAARVKTYGEVLTEYEFHPEAKSADAHGNACGKQTIGLLQRRHVQIGQIKYIGKESNSLEEVEAGLVHSEQNVYTEYIDPRRDEWQTKILPALKRAQLSVLQEKSGFCRRMLMKARAGATRPHRKNRERLAAILKELGLV